MRFVVAPLLSATMLVALGCTPPPPPLLGVDNSGMAPGYSGYFTPIDEPTANRAPVDEATAKLFAPVEGMAVIYIIGQRGRIHGGAAWPIVINDFIAKVASMRFLRVVLPEGRYVIRGGFEGRFGEREVYAKAGQVLFFKSIIDQNDVTLLPVEPDRAKSEILKLKMTDNPYNR